MVYLAKRFFDEAKIEHLLRRNVLGDTQALFREIRKRRSELMEMPVVNFAGQRFVGHSQFFGYHIDGFTAILPVKLDSFERDFDKRKYFNRIISELFVRYSDTACGMSRQVVSGRPKL
jgi:hypothetical protein